MASYNPNAQAPGKTQTQPQSAADVHQAAIDKHGKEAVTQYYNALAGQKAAGANQQQAQAPQVETAGAPAQAPQGNNAVAPGAAGLMEWLGETQGSDQNFTAGSGVPGMSNAMAMLPPGMASALLGNQGAGMGQFAQPAVMPPSPWGQFAPALQGLIGAGMGQANPWLGQGQRAQPASLEAFLQMGGGRPWGF